MTPGTKAINFRGRRGARLAIALLLASSIPARVAAQFERPQAPGTLALQKIAPAETVRSRAESAPWHLGPIRTDPYLRLANLTYSNNVYDSSSEQDQISDARWGASAGIHAYLNLGKKGIATAFARADYVWWKEQTDLRALPVSFGATIYGFFNRMTVEAGGARVERQRDLGEEVRAPIDSRDDRAVFRLKIDTTSALGVVATAETGQLRYTSGAEDQIPNVRFQSLDRDTDRVTLGLEYAFRDGPTVGLGGEYAKQEFLNDPGGRSNESSGPVLSVIYLGKRATFNLVASLRSVQFEGRETRDDLDEPIGTVRLAWQLGEKSELALFGARSLFASALNEEAFSTSDLLGVAMSRDLSQRVVGRLFAESRQSEYRDIASNDLEREETVETLGVTIFVRLSKRFQLRLGASAGERDSTDDRRDATVRRFVASVGFGDDLLPW